MLAAFCLQGPAKEGRACFELRRVPKPNLDGLPPGSVLIRTVATSICGSDLLGIGGCGNWRRPLDYLKMRESICGSTGHEVIGDVVEVVEPCTLVVGQRVLAMTPLYIRHVLGGNFEEETGVKATTLPLQGGFAQYFCSHSCACLVLPTELPRPDFNPLYFVAAQPLGTLIHACKKLGSVMGLDVPVVGQGQNGLIMTRLLANMGARRIIALDLLEERLELSKRYLATHTIKSSCDIQTLKAKVGEITDGAMCDIVVDMVGHQACTFDLCSQLTKDSGNVLLFGLPPATEEDAMSISFQDFTRNLRYICSHSPAMTSFELAMDFIRQGRLDPSPLFTHSMPFEEFPLAHEIASNYKDGVVKILLTYEKKEYQIDA